MKTVVLAFALTLPAAGLMTAGIPHDASTLHAAAPAQSERQERPRVPDDSVELNVSGCLKGRVLAVSDTRETDTQSGPIVRGKSFRLAGKTSKADNDAVVAKLRDSYKVLTVRRAGVAKGQCIRVTPALHTEEADLDRLVEALAAITGTKAG